MFFAVLVSNYNLHGNLGTFKGKMQSSTQMCTNFLNPKLMQYCNSYYSKSSVHNDISDFLRTTLLLLKNVPFTSSSILFYVLLAAFHLSLIYIYMHVCL
jgi:hypothetical protein